MLKNKIICCALLLAALVTAGCGVTIKYSLSGASIPPDAKTFSVAYFPNNAPMVEPILSTTLTDALIDKFTRQTRLAQVDEGGDFAFEGEITGYSSTTASVASDDYALLNRLSITVKVRFMKGVGFDVRVKAVFVLRRLLGQGVQYFFAHNVGHQAIAFRHRHGRFG